MATVFAFAILITYSWAEQNLGEEFPLGVMGGSYTDTHLDFLEQLGFNYVFSFGLGPHTTYANHVDGQGNIKVYVVIDEANEFLDKAAVQGLKVAVYINTCKSECVLENACNGGDWIYDENAEEILRTFVNGIKGHAALGFWVLSDEPEQHCVSADFLKTFYDILKETNKPVANVHCDCTDWNKLADGNKWSDYSASEDIIMPDTYPVKDLQFPQSNDYGGIDQNHIINAFEQAAKVDDLVMPVYQCYKYKSIPSNRCPVYEEVRYWLFTALARGASGVFFYNFGSGLADCGGENYFNTTFKPATGDFNDFTNLIKPDYKPTTLISGLGRGEHVLGIYERTNGTFVVLAHRSEETRTLSLNTKGKLSNTLLLPWGQTRKVSVKIDASGQFTVDAMPWEVFVWKACEQTNNGTEKCDSIDNDCDGSTDEGGTCQTNCNNNQVCEPDLGETFATCPQDCPECINPTKMGAYISQWKKGEISMLTLMQKLKQWSAGTGCPAGQ
jgi:hypothetical protein